MKMEKKVHLKNEEKKSRRGLLKKCAGAAVLAGIGLKTQEARGGKTPPRPFPTNVPRWAMIIDIRRCIGCRACTVACKSEFNVSLANWRTVVKQYEQDTPSGERKCFLPRLCNHCEGREPKRDRGTPPCVRTCPRSPDGTAEYTNPYNGEVITYDIGARWRRPDGITLYDPSKCIHCGNCIKECPFKVLRWNPNIKKDHRVSTAKCSFCLHRVENGVLPSCVNTCQGRARIFGDLNDPDSEVSQLDQEFQLTANRDAHTLRMWQDKNSEANSFVLYIDPDGVLDSYQPREEFSDKAW